MAEPLPPSLLADVAREEAKAREGLRLCELGRNCGFDMDGQEAYLSSLADRLQTIRHTFTPNRIKPA